MFVVVGRDSGFCSAAGALSAKHKSDVIDADMLSRPGELLELEPWRMPEPAQLALRRVVQRRHRLVVDTNRVYRRSGVRLPGSYSTISWSR